MKEYKKPELEVIEIDDDVITASECFCDGTDETKCIKLTPAK